MTRAANLAAMTLASLPSLALACVIDEAPDGWRDPPIAVLPDCAFSEAGQGYYDVFDGTAARDLGNGLVHQTYSQTGQCPGTSETLVVVDCNTREMVQILGKEYPAADGFGHSVKGILAPKGAIRLNARTTIAKLAATAERRSYDHWRDVVGRLAYLKVRNRPDPYCGCRLFYPDSAGGSE
jgi:hypothetical protein